MSVTILETDAAGSNACRRNCVVLDTLSAEVCPTHEPLTGLAASSCSVCSREFWMRGFPIGANLWPDRTSTRHRDSASAAARCKNRRESFARKHADHREHQKGH